MKQTKFKQAMIENLDEAKIKTQILNFCNKHRINKNEFLVLVDELDFTDF